MERDSSTAQGAQAFLDDYTRAIAQGDADAGSFYSETFYFGGPAGGQLVPRAAFSAMVPRLREQQRQLGLRGTKVKATAVQALGATHAQATVDWEVTFDGADGTAGVVASASTYLLEGPAWQIVAQVDHDDLMARVKEARTAG